MYTAVSRLKTQNGLYVLDDFQSSKMISNPKTIKEMSRMRKDRKFQLDVPLPVTVQSDTYFKLSVLNVSSLLPHVDCLSVDQDIETSGVIILTKTWLEHHTSSSSIELPECHIYRKDYSLPNRRPPGWVAVYVKATYGPGEEIQPSGSQTSIHVYYLV
jgi:hypothetical protein